jgi:DNA-directed RNA polymerase specialized sigma24 family protein
VDGSTVTADEVVVIDRDSRFGALVHRVEVPLRRALVAAYGVEAGREAAADALAWAWEHLDRLEPMPNPGGYLFRVGQTAARKGRRWSVRRVDAAVPEAGSDDRPAIEPRLAEALGQLSGQQRAAVLLVHGWGESLVDAAATMGCGVPTLRNHLARGLARLRADLGEDTDA